MAVRAGSVQARSLNETGIAFLPFIWWCWARHVSDS